LEKKPILSLHAYPPFHGFDKTAEEPGDGSPALCCPASSGPGLDRSQIKNTPTTGWSASIYLYLLPSYHSF